MLRRCAISPCAALPGPGPRRVLCEEGVHRRCGCRCLGCLGHWEQGIRSVVQNPPNFNHFRSEVHCLRFLVVWWPSEQQQLAAMQLEVFASETCFARFLHAFKAFKHATSLLPPASVEEVRFCLAVLLGTHCKLAARRWMPWMLRMRAGNECSLGLN